ncbi:uncharacterized protein LOC122665558 [Telopea speciosissima]|uniref:uncharacterized protein LOC122665558 n=1 Tax=Telopea speciosissima TaxID=54955 RepID=UPI001CC33B8E|nr:uncharacterized protein LOC122665558 [Telopea speciosissima]
MPDTSEITSASSGLDGTSQSDFVPFSANPIKLNGANYLLWSRSCLFAIGSSGLSGYITGTSVRPTETGAAQDRWVNFNFLVMSYLVNSMDQEIAERYLLLDPAGKIWRTAHDTYSQVGNAAQCYELRQKLHSAKQLELTLSQYYNKMCMMRQQLDFLGTFTATCDIRANILNRDPLPTLEQAYAILAAEDTRQTAMITPVTQERSALLSSSQPTSRGNSSRSSGVTSDCPPIKCDHHGKEWHTKDHCWKLHGGPVDTSGCGRGGSNRSNNARANQATTDLSLSQVVKELQHLRTMMTWLDTSSSWPPSLATSAVSLPSDSSTPHSSDSSTLFFNYSPLSDHNKVRVADGSLSPISGKGSVQSTPSLCLSSVLHDLETGRTIACGKVVGGLCVLDSSPTALTSHPSSSASTSARATWVYLMHSKSDVFTRFRLFHKMVQTQFDAKVKILRSDNGKEYMDGAFRTYLDTYGIIHQTSCVDTPAQNGVAERKNIHLLEVVRSLMFAMHVPIRF